MLTANASAGVTRGVGSDTLLAMRLVSLPTAWLVLLALVCQPARADIEGEVFRSAEWGIQMRAPSNWQMTEQTSYPNIILHLLRPVPAGRILLSAERITAPLTSREYAGRTIEVLRKLGFRVRTPQQHKKTGAYWIDFDNGKAYLRQALLVSDRVAYALTLSAADGRGRSQHLRAFDYALRSIRIDRANPSREAGADEGPGGASEPPGDAPAPPDETARPPNADPDTNPDADSN